MTERTPWDELLLANVVGREVLRDEQGPIWQHEHFVIWIAEQARAYGERRRATLRADDEFLARGRDLRARVLARRLGLQRVPRPPLVPGSATADHVIRLIDWPLGGRVAPVINLGVAAGVGRELWDEIPDQWIRLPSDIPDNRYVALRIVGESMTPIMHTGDIVLVRLGPDVKVDTVIVARHPDDGYVCKRVSSIRKRGIELASLETGRPLIVIPRDPILVVGTVLLVWHTNHERAIQAGSS
jgi:hypothetical protein